MREEKNNAVFSYIGLTILILIVFIALKVLRVIQWSWLWVLCPLWLPLALSVVIAVVGLVVCGVKALIER